MNLTFSAKLQPGDEFIRLFTEHHQFWGKITDCNNGYVRIERNHASVILRVETIIAVERYT